MSQYYINRLEHGLRVAEQRAADQRIGELAAALTGVRSAVALSLWRGLGAESPGQGEPYHERGRWGCRRPGRALSRCTTC